MSQEVGTSQLEVVIYYQKNRWRFKFI